MVATLDLHKPSMIVSGGASGADSYSERYARENGLAILIFYPNWNLYGKKAGFIRNSQIIEAADEICAFWDGASKGTLDSIDKARKLGKIVYTYMFEDDDMVYKDLYDT